MLAGIMDRPVRQSLLSLFFVADACGIIYLPPSWQCLYLFNLPPTFCQRIHMAADLLRLTNIYNMSITSGRLRGKNGRFQAFMGNYSISGLKLQVFSFPFPTFKIAIEKKFKVEYNFL